MAASLSTTATPVLARQSPSDIRQAHIIAKCIVLERLSTDESCDWPRLVGKLNQSLDSTLPEVIGHVRKLERYLLDLKASPREQKWQSFGTTKSFPRLDNVQHARNRLSFSVDRLQEGVLEWTISGHPREESAEALTEYAQAAILELHRLQQAHSDFFKRASKGGTTEVVVLYWLTEAYKEGPLPSPIDGLWHHLLAIGTRNKLDPSIIQGYRWDSLWNPRFKRFEPKIDSKIPVLSEPRRAGRVAIPISIMLASDVQSAVDACLPLFRESNQCRNLTFLFVMKMSEMGYLLNHHAGLFAYKHLVKRHEHFPGHFKGAWDPAWFEERLRYINQSP
jgi:hypothetical protein